MGMTTQNFGKQLDETKRGLVGASSENMGVDKSTLSDGDEASENTGGDVQSPAALPAAGPEKAPASMSANTGGQVQTPVTGWLNSKKVIATFDGTTPSTKVK
jgi:hypothetical protein